MLRAKIFGALLLTGLAGALGGCNDMNLAGRNIKQQFALPKTGSLLVFVYDRPGSGIPMDVSNRLAMGITKHLNKWTDSHNYVNPDIVATFKQDPKEFAKLDVKTVARKSNADVVVVVDLYEFRADEVSSGLITEGNAQALIRVVDNNGTRLWPSREGMPTPVQTTVAPMTSDQQSLADVKTKLTNDLTVKIGRIFHDYGTDQAELNPK
jgi:hypothetical protein